MQVLESLQFSFSNVFFIIPLLSSYLLSDMGRPFLQDTAFTLYIIKPPLTNLIKLDYLRSSKKFLFPIIRNAARVIILCMKILDMLRILSCRRVFFNPLLPSLLPKNCALYEFRSKILRSRHTRIPLFYAF